MNKIKCLKPEYRVVGDLVLFHVPKYGWLKGKIEAFDICDEAIVTAQGSDKRYWVPVKELRLQEGL